MYFISLHYIKYICFLWKNANNKRQTVLRLKKKCIWNKEMYILRTKDDDSKLCIYIYECNTVQFSAPCRELQIVQFNRGNTAFWNKPICHKISPLIPYLTIFTSILLITEYFHKVVFKLTVSSLSCSARHIRFVICDCLPARFLILSSLCLYWLVCN